MSGVRFIVPGAPRPKERARRCANGHWYTPKKTRDYEHDVATLAQAAGVKLATGPVTLVLGVFPARRGRPDIDNVLKCVADALRKGVAYLDDAQIEELYVRRTLDRAYPRVEVTLGAYDAEALGLIEARAEVVQLRAQLENEHEMRIEAQEEAHCWAEKVHGYALRVKELELERRGAA